MGDGDEELAEHEVDLEAIEELGPGAIVMGMFELTERLGEGSFATAYLAKQLGMDRDVVVKITHANLVRGRRAEMMRERFEVEVRASTRVKHTNIVTIYTAGDVDGAPAIAMEYVLGETGEFPVARRPDDGARLRVVLLTVRWRDALYGGSDRDAAVHGARDLAR